MRITLIPSRPSKARGQLIPLLALIVVALLAVASLVTDVFSLYWAQSNLQRGTDAAALGGATYLTGLSYSGANPSCSYSSASQQAACTIALSNGIQTSEIASITPASDSRSITVITSRNVPAIFSQILGFTSFTVKASAKAGVQNLKSAVNIIPIGLDYRTPYTYGRSITMHNAGCGSGCWGGLALNGTGGAVFQSNLTNGCGCTVTVGDALTSEPGATTGPTTDGIANRISAGQTADPTGTWSSHTLNDLQAATVALVNWHGCHGSCTNVVVIGFAEVWLTGTSGADVNAIFIRQITPGTAGSGTDAGAVHVALLS